MTVQTFTGPKSNDPALRLENIQGDVLIGLQKDAEAFVFFNLLDAKAFKAALRTSVVHQVTSAADVRRRETQIAKARAAGDRTRFLFLGLNIGFTYRGLERLLGQPDFGAEAVGFDAALRAGAPARAPSLGDAPEEWLEPFAAGDVDGVLLVTGPTPATVDNHADAVLHMLRGSVAVVHRELGRTRPERGHEHFGFLDGISQPGVRGLTARENPLDPEQGVPGQDLIWPGEFVFDYPGQVDPFAVGRPATKEEQGEVTAPPLPWMRDGSYMVWRRLEQDVEGFRAAVADGAEALGMDPALLAARMVGRWPSGAPLITAPLQDDPQTGSDRLRNNAFEFGGDPHQRRCPYAAHIRKTYPRDDLNDAGPPLLAGPSGEASVQTRRIRRAGIPFGPELGADGGSRGLMFVCYQTSIEDQFEFVQKDWANAPGFVIGKVRPAGGGGGPVQPGHDPIIGQAAEPRSMDEPAPNYPTGDVRSTLELGRPFVRTTGGAYLFVPSLGALREGPLV